MKAKRAIPQKITGTKATRMKAVPRAKHSRPRIARKPKSSPKPTTLPAPELIEPVTAAEPSAALVDVTREAVETPAVQALPEATVGAPNRYSQRMTIGLSTYQAQKFLLMQRLADKIESLVASILPEESARYDLCIMVEIVEAGPIT